MINAVKNGGWGTNNLLTSAQVSGLQNELLKCVDGYNGGTYNLTEDLTLNGTTNIVNSGVQIYDAYINLSEGSSIEVNYLSNIMLAGGDICQNVQRNYITSTSTVYTSAGYNIYIVDPDLTDNIVITLTDSSVYTGNSITIINPCPFFYADVVYEGFFGTDSVRIQRGASQKSVVTFTKLSQSIYYPTASFQQDGYGM